MEVQSEIGISFSAAPCVAKGCFPFARSSPVFLGNAFLYSVCPALMMCSTLANVHVG